MKAECGGEGCGYTLRITAKWVDDIGAPLCPRHGAMGSTDPRRLKPRAFKRSRSPRSDPGNSEVDPIRGTTDRWN